MNEHVAPSAILKRIPLPALPDALEERAYKHNEEFAPNWRIVGPTDRGLPLSIQSVVAEGQNDNWQRVICNGATAQLWKAQAGQARAVPTSTVRVAIPEKLKSGAWIAVKLGTADEIIGKELVIDFWANPSVDAVGKLYVAHYRPGEKGDFGLNSCFNIDAGPKTYRLSAPIPELKEGAGAGNMEIWFPLGVEPVVWEYRFTSLALQPATAATAVSATV